VALPLEARHCAPVSAGGKQQIRKFRYVKLRIASGGRAAPGPSGGATALRKAFSHYHGEGGSNVRCVTFWVVSFMYDIDDWGSGGGEGGGSVGPVVVGDVLYRRG